MLTGIKSAVKPKQLPRRQPTDGSTPVATGHGGARTAALRATIWRAVDTSEEPAGSRAQWGRPSPPRGLEVTAAGRAAAAEAQHTGGGGPQEQTERKEGENVAELIVELVGVEWWLRAVRARRNRRRGAAAVAAGEGSIRQEQGSSATMACLAGRSRRRRISLTS